jgi:alpha-dioxygenase
MYIIIYVQLLDPHPALVASKLLARKSFIDTGKQFNMIACSWIQFMIHDWIDHLEDTEQVQYLLIIYDCHNLC